jgi:protein-tyrosine phosphatase
MPDSHASQQKKILFVCTGNICRSPMAEGILRKKLTAQNLLGRYHLDSAGTGDWHSGDPADPRTERVLAAHQASFVHAARVLEKSDQSFDYLIAMDRSHLAFLQAKFPGHPGVKMITASDVPDPYYGQIKDFERVFDMLEAAIETFIQTELEPQNA